MATALEKIPVSFAILNKPFWNLTPDETLTAVFSSREGLTTDEAIRRKALFGLNTISERPRMAIFAILLEQFKSPLILILILAGIATSFLGEFVEMGVIFAAIAVNAGLGFYQEYKAEMALSELTTYVRTFTRVRRDGGEHELDAVELVPGDVIRIRQGDRIPADARLLFTNNFEVDEAILTGESLPVVKDPKALHLGTPLPERASMVFAGTLAVQGFADAVVVATDAYTEFGKIAALVESREREKTPLQRAIARFALYIGVTLSILTIGLFIIGVLRGYEIFDTFIIAVAVAVSAVPEGLPIALTVILAIGVQRLAKKKGIVRKLLAAETLGSTSVILTDKTGTLTQAKMKLVDVLPVQDGEEAERELLQLALVNTDAIIENPDSAPTQWTIVGRPLEVALVRDAAARGARLTDMLRTVAILDRLPFNSGRKFSLALIKRADSTMLVAFGAPDILLAFTTLNADEKTRIAEHIHALASEGKRVLGIAIKTDGNSLSIPREEHLQRLSGFTWQGLIAFHDPLRPTVKDAIHRIAAAGVKTIIVTGDHRGTATAVAKSLDLIDGTGITATGDELAELPSKMLRERIPDIAVFARVTPEQKMLIAQIYKSRGEVVAVTGDGVNDAPALREADIGIAVGSGTDVAKSVADLVILDDNFETIVAAIEEGRRIVGNIKKVLVYMLSNVLDGLLLIGGSMLIGLPLPINALQILFINFFSDSFPAIAFAFEHRIDGAGKQMHAIQRATPTLFDRRVRALILVFGVATSLLLFGLYIALIRLNFNAELVRSFIFATFSTYSLILAFSLRSLHKSIVSYNPFSNGYLNAGVGMGVAFTLALLYIPQLQRIFSTAALPPAWLFAVFGVGLLNIIAVEFGKWLFRHDN